MHSNYVSVATKLQRIAEKAKKEPSLKFTRLFHLMNEELLLECFDGLSSNAASGIDHVAKTQYAEHLAENLRNLVDKLHKMAYRPQAVLRVCIPKPGRTKDKDTHLMLTSRSAFAILLS